jgi:hypothetical protein
MELDMNFWSSYYFLEFASKWSDTFYTEHTLAKGHW